MSPLLYFIIVVLRSVSDNERKEKCTAETVLLYFLPKGKRALTTVFKMRRQRNIIYRE